MGGYTGWHFRQHCSKMFTNIYQPKDFKKYFFKVLFCSKCSSLILNSTGKENSETSSLSSCLREEGTPNSVLSRVSTVKT